jgi:hypothetical protein
MKIYQQQLVKDAIINNINIYDHISVALLEDFQIFREEFSKKFMDG